MPDLAFPRIVGESALQGLGQRLALRAAKAIVHGDAALSRTGEQRGYGLVDLDDPSLRGDGWKSLAIVPAAYKESPELFYGPFLQVGTYMRQQGILESDAAAFALDMVVDPLNLATAGTLGLAGKATGGVVSGLTKAGRWGRLMSIFGEGGKITDGAVLFDKMINTLETAGKVSGARSEILAAAKAGDKSALKSILKDALSSGKLADDEEHFVQAMKRDRDIMVSIFNKSEDFRQSVLKEGDFLQNSIRSRLAAGQVNPLLKIAVPVNPLKHPLQFTAQMVGLEFQGERFLYPMSRLSASGLDSVGKGLLAKSRAVKGVPSVAEALDLDPLLGMQDDMAKEFRGSGFASGDLHGWQVAANMQAFRVLVGAPNERILADATGVADTKGLREMLLSSYKQRLPPRKRDSIDEKDFQKFVTSVLAGVSDARSEIDKGLLARRDKLIGDAMTEARTTLDQALASEQITQAQADTHMSQLRRMLDVFSNRIVAWEATSPGNALAARRAIGRVLSRSVHDGMREVIRREYSGRHARRFVSEALGSALAHPGLFEAKDGALALKATREEIAEVSPFLADTLKRSDARWGAGKLEDVLRTKGFTSDVSLMISESRKLLDSIGENFTEYEGVVDRLMLDYFPRVFHPNGKFFAAMRSKGIDVSWMSPQGISQDVEGEVLDRLFTFSQIQEIRNKHGEGKLTFAEVRKFTEEQALAFEKQGLGEYEKDGVRLMAAYLDAANGAQLMNKLVRDMPLLSGALTMSELVARFGQKHLDQLGIKDGDLVGIRRIMKAGDVPEKLKPLFQVYEGRAARLPESEDILGLAKGAADVELSKRLGSEVVGMARTAAAERLAGKTTVRGVTFIDEVGHEVPLDPAWLETGSVPGFLRGRVSADAKKKYKLKKNQVLSPAGIRRHLQEDINAEMVRASKRTRAAQEKLRLTPIERPTQKGSVAIYKGDFGHIQEAFRLYEKSRDPETGFQKFVRGYDLWNYRLKSLVLAGDVFHFNTLSIGQVLSNPMALGVNFAQDARDLIRGRNVRLSNAAVASMVGGGVSGGIGALQTEDPEAIAAFTLIGSIYGAAIGSALKNAKAAGRAFMNPESLDTLMMMGVGGWTGRPDDRSIGVLNRGIARIVDRVSRDPARAALVHPLDGVEHALDAWDSLLWTTLHNGSKHYYFSTMWAHELPRLQASSAYKNADDAGQWLMKSDLARQLVASSNNFFGGAAFRFLMDNPGYQQMMRRLLLSPDWTTSRLAIAANYFMNMGPVKAELMGAGLGTAVEYAYNGGEVDEMTLRGPIFGAGLGFAMRKWAKGIQHRMTTPGDVMAREARRMATAALAGGYTMALALNYAFTGRPIWENPEGRRTHIALPDGSYVALGKAWVEPFEFAGFYDPERYPIPLVSRAVSKGAVLPVRALHVAMNTSGFGGPLVTGDDGPLEMAHTAFNFAVDMASPILLQGPLRLAGEAVAGEATPGSVGRAAVRAAGFQVSGRPQRAAPDLSLILQGTANPTPLAALSTPYANRF